ncbi:MAG: hypothetical protein GWN01_10205 [Nitrosopumilaceae archaeon]|nr:hypothetical protein [Nitrosopumilaceae archaeon]NIU01273.1 hypothetical protein [Nitrosopumilaceae archaeon]NIU87621.1 hypothetical protein [Nitrosopumilaceae archaeon]NIV66046.1 hypothetical protein [Nitrosopumilaceae archaeon]NIX61875.1 hypothetical protein [Nitrosopumilaceae archaeon]
MSTEIMQRAEYYLERSNSFEVAKIYALVRKELYKIDEDARKLKLTRELDPEMYDVMSSSCRDMGERVMDLAREYSLRNKVFEVYNAIRFSNEVNSTYLVEYLRSDKR